MNVGALLLRRRVKRLRRRYVSGLRAFAKLHEDEDPEQIAVFLIADAVERYDAILGKTGRAFRRVSIRPSKTEGYIVNVRDSSDDFQEV